MQFHEGADDGKAKAHAAMARAFGAGLEAFEHGADVLRRNAPALIGDAEDHLAVAAQRFEAHRAVLGAEADGVGQQVEQNLPHALFVRDEAADRGRHLDVERDAGIGEAPAHALDGGVDGAADIDNAEFQLHRPGIDRREVENVVDDRVEAGGAIEDVPGIFALALVEITGRGIGEKLGEADDIGQGRAQFVRDVLHEIRFEQARGDQELRCGRSAHARRRSRR